MKKRDNLKILLLQFRLAKEMRDQEHECFVQFSKLKSEQIEPFYILEETFDLKNLKKYNAIIVGGTGDFEVKDIKEKYKRAYRQLEEIAKYVEENNVAVLASCLQIWSEIRGGKVETLDKQELGSLTIKLTGEAKKDPLFKDMPKEFKAMLGHKDYVSKLPKGAVLLSYSDTCPMECFKYGGNEYFFQFHVELDRKRIIERINFYKNRYAPNNKNEFDELIESIEETPLSVKLMEKFIDKIVLKDILD